MENQWFMPKEDWRYLPSVQKGMKYEQEMMNRLRNISLIECVGYRLELPIYTIATAATLFHRFFIRRTFNDYKPQKIAQACLFIACKTDESSRRANDIAKSWLYKPNTSISERKINAFVSDLLHYELIVLEVTCFDMQIDHPYYELFEFTKEIDTPNSVMSGALAFINDRLPLCIWYDPRAIAAAALLMGYNGHNITIPTDSNSIWGQYLAENAEILTEIAGSIMEVYKLPKKFTNHVNHHRR